MADLKLQLRRQLEFLQTSCAVFDAGRVEEAIRLAVSLRVVFHDTKHSTSLLTLLGTKASVKVLTTFEPGYAEDKATGRMAISIPIGVDYTGARSSQFGLPSPFDRRDFVSVKEWWEQVIMGTNTMPTRRDIILAAANEDGGAHVAPNPKKKAAELIRGVGTFRTNAGGVIVTNELNNHHFYLLRQFAFEVLNSQDIIAQA